MDAEQAHRHDLICIMAAMIYAGGQVPRDESVRCALSIEATVNMELRIEDEGVV